MNIIGSNILSPLGYTTEENLQAILQGRSKLMLHSGKWGLKEPFVASLFSDEQREELHIEGFTLFESIAIQSIKRALEGLNIDLSNDRTCLILSTTKGNIELLEQNSNAKSDEICPSTAATNISNYIGLTTLPIVVCNACISGVNAQILAMRLLHSGIYDYAIVCGAECQGPFIISGFQSLKTVAQEACRPFDIERIGLNLGECAATMIMSATDTEKDCWEIVDGAICNDAVHITNPSPQGDGCLKAIKAIVSEEEKKRISAINVHGTATMFNDQMESKAVERAGLSEIPAFGLKGYWGHTMGANGVSETVLTMAALDKKVIPATRGYEELGVSGKISISAKNIESNGYDFLKVISGFGGCNAAVRYTKHQLNTECHLPNTSQYSTVVLPKNINPLHEVCISANTVVLDGVKIKHEETNSALLTELYHQYVGNYPKFFKMDKLSRLAYIATEMLVSKKQKGFSPDAIVLFNHSSSIVSDRKHAKLILDENEGLASPSVFVYTLPNITTGEIAIKLNCTGETAFYILTEKDDKLMNQIIHASFLDSCISTLLTGWVDYENDESFNADMRIIQR